MSSTLPSRANGYAVALKQPATREFFEAFLSSIHARLVALELTEADYQSAIDAITTQALAIVSANITDEVEAQRDNLAAIKVAADAIIAEVAAIQASGIAATGVRIAAIDGLDAANAQVAFAKIIVALGLKANAADFTTLANTLTGRVDNAIAAIDTRALLLSQALALTGTR
ncbi:hypothetical protein [Aureimonas pseudogalii]|uniref:Uncharacterized protein n=1 Tax=Aureimonas pseudogalii TaxID=1744844 RepID=A0A7W6H2P7_9HYPH|nr:hypothetical protein [Aureimonas pseudogalii]MBB3996875.1 hypothetical protein [Aureimonas pseudogalii]